MGFVFFLEYRRCLLALEGAMHTVIKVVPGMNRACNTVVVHPSDQGQVLGLFLAFSVFNRCLSNLRSPCKMRSIVFFQHISCQPVSKFLNLSSCPILITACSHAWVLPKFNTIHGQFHTNNCYGWEDSSALGNCLRSILSILTVSISIFVLDESSTVSSESVWRNSGISLFYSEIFFLQVNNDC